MTALKEKGLFGPVLALDHVDGSRTFEEHEPDALRQRKNDIRDGKVEGVLRFAILEPRSGKSPDWRNREAAPQSAAEPAPTLRAIGGKAKKA